MDKYQENNNQVSTVYDAWVDYISGTGSVNHDIRSEVLNSWNRSLSYNVNPYQKKVQEVLRQSKLKRVREENELLISLAEPRMKELAKSLYGTDALVTMADKKGVIVNVFGDRSILKKADDIGLIPGSIWNEKVAGTNAVGVVLKTKEPIQILFNEHFSKGWHDWSSTAAPIFHPLTNELLGVYDIAGTFKDVNRHTLQLTILKTKIIAQELSNEIGLQNIESNPYLSTILQSTTEALAIVNKLGEIVKANKKMKEILFDNTTIKMDHETLNEAIKLVLEGKEEHYEEDLQINYKNYTFKVYPLVFDQIIQGALITLNVSLKVTPSQNKPKGNLVYTFKNIKGNSKSLNKAIEYAEKAANIQVNLFISGETGTGKELFAQSIHHASEQKDEPFVAINCSAIPRELIESELFGYESGAFTGANNKGKIGKFEQAQNGTLFLDEVGDMPLDVQVRLLRVLEENEITRVGGTNKIPLNIRLIAATHKNLEEEIKAGRFREDLYYRLKVIDIRLPSLKERGNDIIYLAEYFLKKYQKMFMRNECELTPKVKDLLLEYNWPGNIRELKNVMKQILFNMEDDEVRTEHLPSHIKSPNQPSEKEIIVDAIGDYDGDIKLITKHLGISRATLYRRMKQYSLTIGEVLRKRESIVSNETD